MTRETLKLALISTVYNEEASVETWIQGLSKLTVQPDEFVIVDGGSTDETVLRLKQGFEKTGFTAPHIIVQRCNIAQGRNLAIKNTSHDIIVSLDAGSIPQPRWLEEIAAPFRNHPDIGVVGGKSRAVYPSEFQKKLEHLDYSEEPVAGGDCLPSSRNVAFSRKAWTAVGGYPEWLTLTAEDALYNCNLHHAGIRFYYQPTAEVDWEVRPDLRSYLKMMWSYGYGSAEMGQPSHNYWRRLMTTLFPPLILFSRNPLSSVALRYLRNAASALGWVEGKLRGRKPPKDWKQVGGIWMSPETLDARKGNQL
jgi:cellulose synthase/poly-beta-1,6-N-acetylglucosamine synthase-like glycosyltransferase